MPSFLLALTWIMDPTHDQCFPVQHCHLVQSCSTKNRVNGTPADEKIEVFVIVFPFVAKH